MTDEMKAMCGEILQFYGEEHQQEKTIEETAELTCAIKHKDRHNYIEELADCGIMLEQLYQALSFDEKAEYIKIQHFKIFRQKERIAGESWKPDDLVEQAFRHGFEEGKKSKKE